MRKLFVIMMALMACCLGLRAQNVTYNGMVVSEADGEPLIGVTVMPVGGGRGTATDIEGKFSLTVPSGIKEAQFTYVGFKPVKMALSQNMTVKMATSESTLQDVMVVAYGTATKESFTGSAAVINSEMIENTQASNALNVLNGRVAGVQLNNPSGQPGTSAPEIRIRGISSVNAGKSPLVIVDGAPYSGDINNISPNDIASMTVLKDAASNALYGARGANGVILITTKKGKLGEGKVSVDMKWGSNSRATQTYETITDARQYYELYYQALYNYYTSAQGKSPEESHIWANNVLMLDSSIKDPSYGLGYLTYTAPAGQYLIGADGRFNPDATFGYMQTMSDGSQFWMQPDNWLDYAYKNSLRQEYNVSASQGNDKGTFYLSASYLNNDGIVPNTGYRRFTSRLSADAQLKEFLKVGGSANYTHYNSNQMSDEGESASSGNIFAAATQVAPVYPLFMRGGDKQIMVDDNGVLRYDYGNRTNGGWERPIFTESNALSNAILDTDKSSGNAFSGSAFVEIRFLKDFKFTSNNTVDFEETRSTAVSNPFYGQMSVGGGSVTKQHARRLSQTYQQLLNWNHYFGQHEVTVLLGHENYIRKIESLYASCSNMFDPGNDELAGAVISGNSSSYTTNYNNEGWLGRAQYNYDQKYFGSVSFRRDASSRFHPDHRWGSFWSFGGAWIISKEEFFKAPWVNMLKIKASYGEQGNDNISDYLYVNTFDIVNNSGMPAVTPRTMGNPNITWEKGGNFNAGVEFELFNSRLSGSAEYFYRKTSDMLSFAPLPPSFGYTGFWDNVGDMQNHGVEVDLQGVVVATKDITWTVNANLTWYKNKITMLDDAHKGENCEGYLGYASGQQFYGEGLPIYTYRLRKYAGPDPQSGTPLYYHRVKGADGQTSLEKVTYDKLTSDDWFLCGTALPDVYGGFGTTLEAFGFDFSIDFSYSLGGRFYDGQYAGFMGSPTGSSRGGNFHKDLLNAWTDVNYTSSVPRLQYGDLYSASSSDRFLTSSSYLSLQNINLGYTLPEKIVKKMYLDKVRVYFSAENIWLWAKRRGSDPRQSISGAVNGTNYAPIRTLSGGIQVSF